MRRCRSGSAFASAFASAYVPKLGVPLSIALAAAVGVGALTTTGLAAGGEVRPGAGTGEGACCLALGSCQLLPEADCDVAGGSFLGSGIECSPNPCPQPCEPFDLAGRPSTTHPAPPFDPFRRGASDGEQFGPNRGGTLVLHLDPDFVYSGGGLPDCESAGLQSCGDVVARADVEGPVLIYALALFPEGASPRLTGVTFGIDFPSCVQLLEWSTCADFEIADPDWPTPGSGTAVAWTTPQTTLAVPVYQFAASGYAAEPGELAITPHQDQGTWFADDSVPAILDPIEGLGSFGFFRSGVVPCPHVGACCFRDGTCRVVTASDCDAVGGESFELDMSCSPNPCPQPALGACCLGEGACSVLTFDQCTASGGSYEGDDTVCSPNPCPQLGACCLYGGSCIIAMEADCDGTFQGDDTSCDPNPCPIWGACCFPSGSCSFTTYWTCGYYDGTFQGQGTECSPNPCPQPTGACCIGETCQVLLRLDCTAAGGEWLGADYPCDPNPCLDPAGACCFADGSCLFITESDCEAQFGRYLLDAYPCDPNPCPVGGGDCGFHLSYESRVDLRRQVLDARRRTDVLPAVETGRGVGSTLESGTAGSCGWIKFNADRTYENSYAWQYGGVVPPMYGAFVEIYDSYRETPCAIVLDLTQTGGDAGQTLDLYAWSIVAGLPGQVLGIRTGVDPGPIATWPSVSEHVLEFSSDCADSMFLGFWGNWPGGPSGWFVGADLDGFGGCPMTNIAPGIGYPTGWQNVSIVWGPTQAIGIGGEFIECGPVPVQESSWGKVKALFR
ncbi:MAG: hypothetical protein R3E97_05480 [Candidatus Eisenbacteria bacterium]